MFLLILKNNLFKWSVFTLYFLLLIYLVFFARRRQELIWQPELLNLIPFRNTIQAWHTVHDQGWLNFLSNLFGNILLFLPLPFFSVHLFKVSNKILIIGAGVFMSMLIEFLQYYCRIGIPDIDDVLLNTTGVIAGVLLWHLTSINSKIRL